MEMNLEEYKKQLEKIAKKSGNQYLEKTFQKTEDKIWQMYLDESWDPSTALHTEAQGM